jgi:hypothetical protein
MPSRTRTPSYITITAAPLQFLVVPWPSEGPFVLDSVSARSARTCNRGARPRRMEDELCDDDGFVVEVGEVQSLSSRAMSSPLRRRQPGPAQ